MKRVIVHSDINHCYAQIEEMMHPNYRRIPMAVGGSEEKRHGIILAKNDIAKSFGIKTGESLREALKKCPGLKIVHPSYESYVYYTEKIKDIYRKYTDRVESFGLDEAWFDLSASQRLFGEGIELAKQIQDEVFDTYGITVSMGVSFNKVFAKLGSDIFKHKGFAVITEENYKEIVWPLDVGDLIMVGRHTQHKLSAMGIYTIGDLANAPSYILQKRFGKMGVLLWNNANGLDRQPVAENGYVQEIKSIGNSKTVVHDIICYEQLEQAFMVLCESTAARMRMEHKRGYVLSIWLRNSDLKGCSKQKKLKQPTDLAKTLLKEAMALARQLLPEHFCLRSIGVNVSDLTDYSGYEQLDLFTPPEENLKQRALEDVLVQIRSKYGYQSCRMASSHIDEELTDFDPLAVLHQVHPISYLKGPI